MTDLRKWDVIDVLRQQHGLQHLVQILTPSTGADIHGRPELKRFAVTTTLMFASDQQRNEMSEAHGLPTLEDMELRCRTTPLQADLVFVDTWHTYDDSLRSLELAASMLTGPGFIVVHDCDPPTIKEASRAPTNCTVGWCGETWRAFVDFTATLERECDWYVIESDSGIGVIAFSPTVLRQVLRSIRRWRRRSSRVPAADVQESWNWLVANRAAALRPITSDGWRRRMGVDSED